MPMILRLDVDKPFGNGNLFRRIISKLREDYYFPPIKGLGYIEQAIGFAEILNQRGIAAIFYFRNCTAPDSDTAAIFKQLGHLIGFHAEDTRTFESFEGELNVFKKKTGCDKIHSFSKHGSGELKLGRHHYAPYEEEKYLDWSKKVNVPFIFGNGVMDNFDVPKDNFYPKMFWVETGYRDLKTMSIEKCIANAKNAVIPILTHPENYFSIKQTREDFDLLAIIAAREGVEWFVPN